MKPDKWIKCLGNQKFSMVYKGYLGGFDFWVDNQKRNFIQRKLLNLILKIKDKLPKMPDSKLYSPYCGIILKKKKNRKS